eukprot:1173278-Prorocentrum_minimum.AAC.1
MSGVRWGHPRRTPPGAERNAPPCQPSRHMSFYNHALQLCAEKYNTYFVAAPTQNIIVFGVQQLPRLLAPPPPPKYIRAYTLEELSTTPLARHENLPALPGLGGLGFIVSRQYNSTSCLYVACPRAHLRRWIGAAVGHQA